MRSKAALFKGGETGSAVVPGSPEKSLLWVKIAADKMPPGPEKLTAAEKTLFAPDPAVAHDDGSGAKATTDVSEKRNPALGHLNPSPKLVAETLQGLPGLWLIRFTRRI